MENNNKSTTSESLILTKHVFYTLLNAIINHFKESHKITGLYKDSQLFGFGNYDEQKPSIKKDLELILKGYINGKYLYNKSREVAKGKPYVKLSREYKYAYFKYIGYKNIHEFIESEHFSQIQKAKQIQLINQTTIEKEHFYVCYYIDEDFKMNKGQMIISKQWKHAEIKFIYEEEGSNNQGIYLFFGNITTSEGYAFFDMKYIVDNKKREGVKMTFFVGISSVNERLYLIGTYTGFDKYERVISGKMILKKMENLPAVEKEMKSKHFDPILCQELNQHRLVINSEIKKNPLLLSKKSLYSQALFDTHGVYMFDFKLDNQIYSLKCEIEKYHYNIVSHQDYVIIDQDKITILNKGQIINLDFIISGIFNLQKVSIYIKYVDFLNPKNDIIGIFNGVDINNNLVSGKVKINPIK